MLLISLPFSNWEFSYNRNVAIAKKIEENEQEYICVRAGWGLFVGWGLSTIYSPRAEAYLGGGLFKGEIYIFIKEKAINPYENAAFEDVMASYKI